MNSLDNDSIRRAVPAKFALAFYSLIAGLAVTLGFAPAHAQSDWGRQSQGLIDQARSQRSMQQTPSYGGGGYSLSPGSSPEAYESAERERQAAAERERQAAAERERQAAAERERQAAAERQRKAEADRVERERVAAVQRKNDEEFIRDRDASPLRGPTGAAQSQLRGTAGMGNSGLRGIESFGSASVVDARGPRDSDYLINQRPELARSPAADRIRHGLIVMREHNWPVALASFQYALQLDPDNASIKELEVQAQRMVDRKKETAAGPVTPLAVAIHSASRGDNANAIRQFELVKAENPAIAAQADSMIAALRQRQKADASGVVRWNQEIVKADA